MTPEKKSRPRGSRRIRINGQKISVALRPVVANVGIRIDYARRLTSLIDQMGRSVRAEVLRAYRAREPEVVSLAQDVSPAAFLRSVLRTLSVRWSRRFDEASRKLAQWFSTAVHRRSDSAMRKILKDAGISVEFKMSAAQNDVMQATIGEQVGLIRSIPRQYLQQVEGMVMRSVAMGRDLKQLSDDLQRQLGVTRRRAHLIARDQNNKATATITRVKQLEAAGPDAEAVWVHSGGGKEPRPTHYKAGKERIRFKVAEGWWDPHEKKNIQPGELINCRCVSRLVVPGFT